MAGDEAKLELQPGGLNSNPGNQAVTWYSELKLRSARHKNEVLQITSG